MRMGRGSIAGEMPEERLPIPITPIITTITAIPSILSIPIIPSIPIIHITIGCIQSTEAYPIAHHNIGTTRAHETAPTWPQIETEATGEIRCAVVAEAVAVIEGVDRQRCWCNDLSSVRLVPIGSRPYIDPQRDGEISDVFHQPGKFRANGVDFPIGDFEHQFIVHL